MPEDQQQRHDEHIEQLADDGMQHPLIHDGGGPAPTYHTNEKADDKAEIVQPSGDPAPTAEGDTSG